MSVYYIMLVRNSAHTNISWDSPLRIPISRHSDTETRMMAGVLREVECGLCQLILHHSYVRKAPPPQRWNIAVFSCEFTAGYFWVGKLHCNRMTQEFGRIQHKVTPRTDLCFIRHPFSWVHSIWNAIWKVQIWQECPLGKDELSRFERSKVKLTV